MDIRKDKCYRCSCMSSMKEIEHYKNNIPKDEMQASSLDEIIRYWDLEWELFQCYMDNNGTKCKWLYDFTNYLENNPEVFNNLEQNLYKYKQKQKWILQIL